MNKVLVFSIIIVVLVIVILLATGTCYSFLCLTPND